MNSLPIHSFILLFIHPLPHPYTCTLTSCTLILRTHTQPHCWGIPEEQVVKYKVKNYGFLRGEAAMMAEIEKNGPITCSVATPDLFNFGYHGGVWTEDSDQVDHDVEVVGWGEEDGMKYWLIRNSWGSYWGLNSFFKLERGANRMHIEEQCAAAEVDLQELWDLLDGKKVGSMYGVIDPQTKPQYFPEGWEKQTHKWTNGSAIGMAGEEKINLQLDQVWAREEAKKVVQAEAAAPAAEADSSSSRVMDIVIGTVIGAAVTMGAVGAYHFAKKHSERVSYKSF